MKRLPTVALAVLGLCASPLCADEADQPSCEAHQDVVLRAMCDELRRSTGSLQLEQLERPYFLSYRVDDRVSITASGHFGALASSARSQDRVLAVEVRVGSPALDNSNYLSTELRRSPLTRRFALPLDDDYRELRRQMWLATDIAYKHALETLSKKRAALQNKTREDVPDFLDAQPHVHHALPTLPEPPLADLETTARRLSAVFAELPSVDDSWVHVRAQNLHMRYVNSEGSSYTTSESAAFVRAAAKTQAADGTLLQDTEAFRARTWQELPPPDEMAHTIRRLGASLMARRQAEFVDLYNGPVLFAGQAAAELFGQAFVGYLLATRAPVADARIESYAASARNPFLDKIGARVLPRLLNVYDDPTATENAGGPLLGGYAVDGEGVPSTPTTLIENGILKTLLTTRNPVAGISHSTGNRRSTALLPSNLIVATQRGSTPAELHDEFMALVRERGLDYGIRVERLSNSLKLDARDRPPRVRGQVAIDHLARAFRVYPDGREEPIPKAELSGFSETAFKDIVAVSQSVSNHSPDLWMPRAAVARYATPWYGTTLEEPGVTVSIPDLLFEEATIRRPTGNAPRPPELAHPHFE